MKKQNDNIWTKDFILHGLGYFMMFASFYFLLPTLPVYVVDILHEDKSKIGYIIGIYAISSLAVRPFSGYALDKYGRRPVFLIALITFAAFMGAYFVASSFLLLMAIRFGQGLSWGFITTGGSTIASDIVPSKKRGEGLGYFGMTITLAMSIGPLIGLSILQSKDFNYLFSGALILSVLSILLTLQVKHPDIKSPATKVSLGNLFEKRVIHISIMMLVSALSYAGIISFITLYGDQLGIKNPGHFFTVYAVGIVLVRVFGGRVMDRKGPAMLMSFSFLFTIGGLVLLSFISSFFGFLVSAFIIGLGNGIIMPTIQTMVVNIVPAQRRGVANSTLYSALDLGMAIGSVLLGYISEMFSIAIMYRICGLSLFAPLLYFLIFTLKDYNQKVKLVTE